MLCRYKFTRILSKLILFVVIFIVTSAASTYAIEPTWLFTIPKAEAIGRGYYDLGFIYADFGVARNMELGVHGFKYSIPRSRLAFGFSLFPMASPYIVTSQEMGCCSNIHLGLKAAPYIIFAGFETYIASNIKLIAEINNGLSAGVRVFPARKWTLDIFFAFVTAEVYKYNYGWAKIEDYYPLPGIFLIYSGNI
jgi:hypothetical protein